MTGPARASRDKGQRAERELVVLHAGIGVRRAKQGKKPIRIRAKRASARTDDDRRFRLISRVIDGLIGVASTLIIAGAVVWIVGYLRDVLIAFAGKETNASLAFTILAKIQADRWLAYLFGAGGIGYGLVERRLRTRNIRRLTKRPTELETRIHPARTSSGLTPEGRTRREDR